MSEFTMGMVMPHNIDAEQAVLAAMFFDREAIYEAVQIINRDDFYRLEHGVIFDAMLALNEANKPVDLITMAEELRREANVDKAGGITYVASVANMAASASNITHYANIVKEKAVIRQLIRTASNISNRGYENSEPVEDLLDDAERMILEISQGRERGGLLPIRGVIESTIDRLERLYMQKEGLTGVTSGFIDLDRITSGWQKSDFIILAARPAMGKTAFGLNMAQNAAIKTNTPVAIFSLEMSKEQLVQRMVSSESQIDQQRIRTGRLQEGDWAQLITAISPLAMAPIYIDDTPSISVRELRAKARRLQAERGLGLIIIDYLQLMSGGGRSENRQQEVSQISRSLKGLARELDVPVIALSQLSRMTETTGDKRPSLSHLRESGSLEQDADLVLFIYRDEYYNEDSERKGVADIIIAKHRNGATGTVELSFRKEFTKFGNLLMQPGE